MQEKLLLLRKRRGLSQGFMADLLDISQTQYGAKERGVSQFTSDEMFILSDFFGMMMDDIFLPRGHQIGDENKLQLYETN